MREAGLRFWFALDKMVPGYDFSDRSVRAVQVQNRLPLVLAENSIAGD